MARDLGFLGFQELLVPWAGDFLHPFCWQARICLLFCFPLLWGIPTDADRATRA